jgi:hypothetical protein
MNCMVETSWTWHYKGSDRRMLTAKLQACRVLTYSAMARPAGPEKKVRRHALGAREKCHDQGINWRLENATGTGLKRLTRLGASQIGLPVQDRRGQA